MILKMEDHKKQILLKHIREFISSQGERDITMQDIADHCGVAKGTLYNYFSGKEELLTAVIQDILEPFDREVESVFQDNSMDPDKKLKSLIKIHIRFLIESRNFLVMHIKESSHSYTLFQKKLTQAEEFKIKHTQWFLGICSFIMKEKFPDSNSEMLAYMFHEMLKSHLIYALYNHKEVNEESDSENLFNFFMHGASECTFNI